MTYDTNNVYAKILRGELPSTKVYENEHAVAFRDINPQAPIHVLVISKGAYTDHFDFESKATREERLAYYEALRETAKVEGVQEGGYRLISNCGENSGQEVPHFHTHLLGGKPLGRLLGE